MSNHDIIDRYATSDDGLRLHYIDVAPASEEARTPVVCLPGLARTTDDFRPLAFALAHFSATPRRVLAFDYRGRGCSGNDPDWRHYNLDRERADFLSILNGLGITRAHFIGTSRGGLHILGLAAASRDLIQSAVFNDIGPVLEPAGLARIKSYIGKSVPLNSIAEGIDRLRTANGRHFDRLSANEWRHFAETTFGTDETKLGLRYDPQLARTLDTFDLGEPLPQLWHLFDKLEGVPVLTIRGGNSDLLSEATLNAMESRWPESEAITVPGQGHAPLLMDQATTSRIEEFLRAADRV